MQKLNALGVELQSLKIELLNKDYPDVVKRALRGHADKLAETEIDVDLHVSLTDNKISSEEFTSILLEHKACLKTPEELLVEYEKIREEIQKTLDERENIQITSKSLVEEEQIAFAKTFKLDKEWVSEYFGQSADEVGKLMIRNGFIEKFAVLRLSKILEDYLKSDLFKKDKEVDCKATRVFYDLEQGYYGIHLMFYVDIEVAEDKEKVPRMLDYICEIHDKVVPFVEERLKI